MLTGPTIDPRSLLGVGEVVLREANAADYEPWRAAYAEVAAEGKWIGGEVAPPDDEMRERFTRDVDDPSRLMLIMEVGSGAEAGNAGVVGGLGCHFVRSGVGHIGMQLLPDWRGQGLGGRLLVACIEWCREKGAHKVALEAWPHNQRAIDLYARHGFEVEGRLHRHYRRRNGELWDAVLMGLVLDTSSPGSPYPDAR